MSTEHMRTIEARIIAYLINTAIDKGWVVSVNDGEEWTLQRSKDYEAITDAMCSTDCDELRFRNADDQVVGTVLLIYGNDRDIIADCSMDANWEFDAFMLDAMNFAETCTA